MSRAQLRDVALEHHVLGDPADPPLVLINGLGEQLVAWPRDFLTALTEHRLQVITFDNRDTGLSTMFHEYTPDLEALTSALAVGDTPTVPYLLSDMADDVVGLLQHLGLSSAHVCGFSMGGMIAQTLAALHPTRVRSLISLSSSPGPPDPDPEVTALLTALGDDPVDLDQHLEFHLTVARSCAGDGLPFDEAEARDILLRAHRRNPDPTGANRQLAAVLASGSREAILPRLRTPTLVIHGTQDRWIPPENGLRIAELVPGARLVRIEAMGHWLAGPIRAHLAQLIADHVHQHARPTASVRSGVGDPLSAGSGG
ncbi:alpha/beta fold hydrolase [Streptomyces sp. SS7]|uniref:alpha/beta fold hydrolase n=1 Tax=Streptomyces sp. SS7 TaxID=3108485 RepID=UPI0030EB3B34